MRWRMHKRTEQKEDGRLIYYYTFTPAEPTPPVPSGVRGQTLEGVPLASRKTKPSPPHRQGGTGEG
jgi:hypothetical protein